MGFPEAAYTLMEIEAILGAGVKGVKQVAHGAWDFTDTANKVITTGLTVDPAKTIVLIDNNISGMVSGFSFSSAQYGLVGNSILRDITSTTITVTPCYAQVGTGTNRVYGSISWQLVEFY